MSPPLFNISFPPLAFPHLYVVSIPIIYGHFPKTLDNFRMSHFFVDFWVPSTHSPFLWSTVVKKKKKSKVKYKFQVDLLAWLLSHFCFLLFMTRGNRGMSDE